ncbi:MAG TPA: SUMF1/EgtB/PvdO family nonheme iron enzyme [Thermoanaerobaculia bacterium]|nr:SUMF1/EgtB/PvdO family nonheme iron enzyme [Thermoanaerobaculia bacterium]
MPNRIEVFLSHNGTDKPAVRELAAALRARDLEVWLDEDSLLPGEPWQKALEEVLATAGAGAVLVGQDGLGPWEDFEMRALLSQFVARGLLVIPVLLPGSPEKPELPLFLREFTWSDLRAGMTPAALDRLVDGIRRRQPATPGADPLLRYRAWAAARYDGLSLIGLGGGDLGKLRFDEIYVPLHIVRRPQAFPAADLADERRQMTEANDELGIESLFLTPRAATPHAILLGDPGAGKTTGLLKLLHRCLEPKGPEALGLDSGTLPVFLRLRRFTADDLFRPFTDFLQRELERELGDVAKGEIPRDLSPRLWEHSRLLLLLDGLDEIADEGLRAEVCRFLEDLSPIGAGRESLRAVVSCRFAGYSERVRLSGRFSPLEVRPLDAAQCRDLVRHWFRAAQRALPDRLSPQEALRATESLLAALDGPGYGSQRWKVLVGSPLLLTLLCVIAYRGGQMPRHRSAFYDQCLRVLLGPWSHGKRDSAGAEKSAEPPLDVETALALLRSIAWQLHCRQSWDDLSVAELADLLADCLAPRGRQVGAREVLEWLHREAGVLADYGEHRYGLLHLGLQEYLAASHVASQGVALLDELCAHAGEEWWQEVFLLLSGLPGHAVFAPLLEKLLASKVLLDQADLLRACLEEAAEPDLGPFLAALGPEVAPERQATVLRLLRGRQDPRIEAPVRALLGIAHPDVAALARQFVDDLATRPEAKAGEAVFVLHHPADKEMSVVLAQALRGRGWQAAAGAEDSTWRKDPERLVREARGVVVAVGPIGQAPWEKRELASCLRLFARGRRAIVIAQLPASGDRPALPEFLRSTPWVDLRGGLSPTALEALDRTLAEASAPVSERSAFSRQPVVEPQTGLRFVWVQVGRFQMGDREWKDSRPVHPVWVSPFWLGETPVSNAQYAVFLEQTGAAEPLYWRDRRFSSPEQPVVGVSWEDAQAFCRWLGEVWGRAVMLPSEAQWELASRGATGRKYPWGDEPPDATRACFGLDWEKGQPAPVGSCPAGRGPFGTLDQAGNVWEWCRDAWDDKTYVKRAAAREVPRDPIAVGSEGSVRVVRGGGWFSPAGHLRAAFRDRYPSWRRYDVVGFRVAAALESLGS